MPTVLSLDQKGSFMKLKIACTLFLLFSLAVGPFIYWYVKIHDPVQLQVIKESWLGLFFLACGLGQLISTFVVLRDVWLERFFKLKGRHRPTNGN